MSAMARRPRRFPWLAFLAGVLLGVVAGLVYAWFIDPVRYTDVGPNMLDDASRREYLALIADAYQHDGDLDRAQRRLALMDLDDVSAFAAEEADAALLAGENPARVRSLTTLAEALGGAPRAASVFSGTPVPTSVPGASLPPTEPPEPTPEASPTPGITPTPTLVTPSPTPDLFPRTEMSLSAREIVCEEGAAAGRIEVMVLDGDGAGIPGVEVQVVWGGGQESFFTGLKPERGLGYADYQMQPGETYSLTLVGRSDPVAGLSAGVCTTDSGAESVPGYRLTFTPRTAGAGEGF